MTFPSIDLFPGPDLFPGLPGVVDVDGYAQPIEVALSDLVLTATDDFGVDWIADTLTGWYGSPASTMEPVSKLRAPGSWPAPRQMGFRPLTISGFVLASTPAALLDAFDRLNQAASLNACTVTVSEEGQSRSLIVYRQGEVLITRASPVAAIWSVQLQALEPRKFGSPIISTTRLPSSIGGLTWPVTWPITWTGVTVTGTIHIDNPGNYASPLFARIDGAVLGPRIRHITSGVELTLGSSYQLPAGSWLDVDMENKSVLEASTTTRNRFITSRDWFDIDPGGNDVIFDAAMYSAEALLTLTTLPAYQ